MSLTIDAAEMYFYAMTWETIKKVCFMFYDNDKNVHFVSYMCMYEHMKIYSLFL